MDQQTKTADSILEVATARAVQMYRTGASQESVYWVLLHAGLTAEMLTA